MRYYKVTTQAAADTVASAINSNYSYADGVTECRSCPVKHGSFYFVPVHADDEQYLTPTQQGKLVDYDVMAAEFPPLDSAQ